MSRSRGRQVLARLDGRQRPAELAGEHLAQRIEAGEPSGSEWYHLGATRQARRAEVVPDAPEPEEGEQAPEPAEEAPEDVEATTADVYVYDAIGGWFGISADDFVRDVAALDVERIVLHLNSPGGDVWDGVAIANMLRQHQAEVIVRVDGVAASAASVIAMAGDVIVMGLGSTMMIHDAWTYVAGNPAELRHEADVLDSLSNGLAETYVARAGGTVAEWRAIMAEEGWYTASEAVAAGLADRVADDSDNASSTGATITPGLSAADSWWWDAWDDLSKPERHSARLAAYRHAGRAEAPAPPMPSRQAGSRPPAATATGSTTTQRGGSAVELTDEQVGQVRQQLSLPENSTREQVQAALNERLAPAAATGTVSIPEGFVLVESSTFDTVQARATRGDEARSEQERVAREREVDAAIGDGRIARAARESWLTQLTPIGDGAIASQAATILAQLPKGVIPVDGARGYTGGDGGDRQTKTRADVRNDPAYAGWKVS